MTARLRIVAALAAAASTSIALASDLPVVESDESRDPAPITSVNVTRSSDVMPSLSATPDVERTPATADAQSDPQLGSRQTGQWIQPYSPSNKSAGTRTIDGTAAPQTSVIPLPGAAGLAVVGLAGVLVGRRRFGRSLRG